MDGQENDGLIVGRLLGAKDREEERGRAPEKELLGNLVGILDGFIVEAVGVLLGRYDGLAVGLYVGPKSGLSGK
jgi:hypothetical protein